MSAQSAGISKREFAKRDGCDEKLVREAVKSGRLKPFSDGTLDPELVGTGWRQKNRRKPLDPAESFKEDPPRRSAHTFIEPPLAEAAEALGVTPDIRSLTAFCDRLIGGEYNTELEAITVKENGLALKHVLDALTKAGDLISVSDAESVIFENFRNARDAWNGFSTRIGPKLAAELGVDAAVLTEALAKYVHQQLASLGDPSTTLFAPRQT